MFDRSYPIGHNPRSALMTPAAVFPPPFRRSDMTSLFSLPTLRGLRWAVLVVLGSSLSVTAGQAAGDDNAAASSLEAPASDTFLQQRCYDCHSGETTEGGLDLARLSRDLSDPAAERKWVRVFDRVHDGEMPPTDSDKLPAAEKTAFLDSTGQWIRDAQQTRDAELGRVRARRLTRREVERSLQDLLGIDIPLADQLPADATGTEFSTVADGQSMSHFQLERHLAVVDLALDEALRRALSEEDHYSKHLSAFEVARRERDRRTREAEIIDDLAVVWSSGLAFYGRVPNTAAPDSGWYRFKLKVAGLKPPSSGGVWCTIRSGMCVSSAPLLSWIGSFEAIEFLREIEFEAWLPARHMLEIRPGDDTLRRAKFNGGQVGNGEGAPQNVPGIAIESLTMERIHRGPDNAGIRRLLFGDVPVTPGSRKESAVVKSDDPHADAERLILAFASRVFRRPATREDLQAYLGMVHQALDNGAEFPSALRMGYRALLCSPRFLYFTEAPGPLDDFAIATRLSYFLTGSTPDSTLFDLAAAGRLRDRATLHQQIDRLIDTKGTTFIEDFAAEWLDLDQINFTEPDSKLFGDYDSIVEHTMLDETHQFLNDLLSDDLSVGQLIHSDYTWLNSRLARYYEIKGVEGDALRRVALKPEDHRGGVLTQGAVLKVTANGSNTSPVVRGVWISDRLLGQKVPPPPPNVPAIEPDIRGAKTIREMLARHRADDACASCHVKIDPAGFALENYDPAGQWRERYVQVVDGKTHKGAEIDAGYTLPDGREFKNIDDFRRLILAHPEQLARTVAEKLLTYGTGAPMSFADRQAVDEMVRQAAASDYGLRSIVHAVVSSQVFLSK